MILTYYGRNTRVAECQEYLGIGRDGVTARGISNAARAHGLRVKAYSLEPSDFKHVKLPAIVHWNFNHFVVVDRWSQKNVEIVDPAVGRRKLSKDEFDASFTGVTLVLEPGVNFAGRRKSSGRVWRTHVFQYISHSPGLLAQIACTSLFLQLLGLALPVLTKIIVDYVLPFQVIDLMALIAVGMILFLATQIVVSYMRTVLLIYLQAHLDSQIMVGFFEHLLALPFGYFQQRTSGDLLLRLNSNALIREMLTGQTISVVIDSTFVTVYIFLLFTQDVLFGVIVLAVGLIQIAILLGSAHRMQGLMQRDLTAQAESHSYLVEALTKIETLKAAGAEDRALEHWSNLFFNQLNVAIKRSYLSGVIETAMLLVRVSTPLILIWIGAQRVLAGTMSLGTMLALNALAASFLLPLSSLVSNGQRLQLVGSHMDRLADVMQATPEQDLSAVRTAPKLTGRIEIKQVSFQYDPNSAFVLRDISLAIESGQKVALVGQTGSGKSTLIKLLLGLYEPIRGEISYDGVPLQLLNHQSLRSQMGVVTQESSLFSGSIRRNIALSDPNLSLDAVVRAARIAAIHDEINVMPMKYETIVGEGNTGFSGGQFQRMLIARALARQPAILLLDEATSHLDAMTEQLVEENLSNLTCTRIVIAHRLSTVRNADVILILDKGKIVESGSHEQLLANGGHYTRLVDYQL